jgi:hypothetical protein
MPWSIKTDAEGCNGFAVVKDGESKPIPSGCHKSRPQALKQLVALRLSYDERQQPRTPDGKFASTGGGGGGGGSAGGGTYKAGDKAGSKAKSAPKNVTGKGVNNDSEYVLSEKTGNFFKNPTYNGNPNGKGKYSPAGKNKAKQGSVDDLEGGPKFKATGQAKHKVGGATKAPAPAKPVSAKPASSGTKLSSPEGEITGDANAVSKVNKQFEKQNILSPQQLHTDVNAGQSPLKPGERAAVVRYTGAGYSGVNNKLRNEHGDLKTDSTYDAKKTKEIAKLDKTLSSRQLSQDVAVSRRVNLKTEKLQVGDEIYDPAFQSFSTTKRNPFGTNSSTIETVLPKGTKGMSVRSVSKYTSEDEILLPAGMTMKVTSIRGVKDGGKYITVELVSQGVRKGEAPQPVRSMHVGR